MVDINLATGSTQTKNFNTAKSVNVGVIVAVVLMFLTLAVYGGLYFYNSRLKTEISAAEQTYITEIGKLTLEKNLNVFDFQNRIGVIKKEMIDSSVPLGILGKIEQDILPDVYLNSLSYDSANKALDLSCLTNGFNTFAKQIASFKGDDYFSEVNTNGASLNQDGKWEASIKLKIK